MYDVDVNMMLIDDDDDRGGSEDDQIGGMRGIWCMVTAK